MLQFPILTSTKNASSNAKVCKKHVFKNQNVVVSDTNVGENASSNDKVCKKIHSPK